LRWGRVPSVCRASQTTGFRNLRVRINGFTATSLLDSAAGWSAVSRQFLNRLDKASAISSNSPKTVGLRIEIFGESLVFRFRVWEKISHDITFGEDFLIKHKARVEYERGVIAFGTPSERREQRSDHRISPAQEDIGAATI